MSSTHDDRDRDEITAREVAAIDASRADDRVLPGRYHRTQEGLELEADVAAGSTPALPMRYYATWHLQRSAETGYAPAAAELRQRCATIQQALRDEGLVDAAGNGAVAAMTRYREIDEAIVETARQELAQERAQ